MSSVTQVVTVRSVSTPRSASRVHARPPIDDSVARIVTTFEKTLADLTARLAALEGENASLKERLITAEAQSAEKETATTAGLAAQAETISAQAATIAGLTETVSALTGRIGTLQKDIEPLLEKHYAPPPPLTRKCPIMRDGVFTGDFYAEVFIDGQWKWLCG